MLNRVWNSATFTTWAALGVRLGGFAVLLPLLLAQFTAEEVSVWLLFSSIASLQLVADLGFSQTFSREIAYLHARSGGLHGKDVPTATLDVRPELDITLGAMQWIYRRLTLLAILLLATAGSWAVALPIERLADPDVGYFAWLALSIATATSVYGNRFSAVLVGTDRIHEQKRWETALSLLSLSAQIACLLLGGGLLLLVVLAQMAVVVQVLLNRKLASRAIGPVMAVVSTQQSLVAAKALWPAAWRAALGSSIGVATPQGVSIFVANALPVTEAAAIQLAMRLMQMVSQFAQVPFYAKLPQLNRLRANGSIASLMDTAAIAMRTCLWLFVAISLLLGLTLEPLLAASNSATPAVSASFWGLLMLAFFAERYGAMHLQLLSTSRVVIWHIANGVAGAIVFAGLLVLFPVVGTYAIALSMVGAYLGFYAWFSALKSHRVLSGSLAAFEARASLGPMVAVMAGFLVMLMVKSA